MLTLFMNTQSNWGILSLVLLVIIYVVFRRMSLVEAWAETAEYRRMCKMRDTIFSILMVCILLITIYPVYDALKNLNDEKGRRDFLKTMGKTTVNLTVELGENDKAVKLWRLGNCVVLLDYYNAELPILINSAENYSMGDIGKLKKEEELLRPKAQQCMCDMPSIRICQPGMRPQS